MGAKLRRGVKKSNPQTTRASRVMGTRVVATNRRLLASGPHRAMECPLRNKLSALIQEEPKREERRMGSLQLLNFLLECT